MVIASFGEGGAVVIASFGEGGGGSGHSQLWGGGGAVVIASFGGQWS